MMGLLSRIGGQFAEDMPLHAMGQDALKGMSYGGVGGALVGAGVEAPGTEAGGMPGPGMMLGGAAGAALGGAAGLRHIVMTIARALKQQHPQIPDEMILKKAQELAEQQGGQAGGGMMPPMGGGGMPPGGGM